MRKGRDSVILPIMRGLARFALLLALAAVAPASARASDAPAQDGRRTQEIVFVIEKLIRHKEIPPLPGSDYFEPGDLEFYLLNRIEGRTGQ